MRWSDLTAVGLFIVGLLIGVILTIVVTRGVFRYVVARRADPDDDGPPPG